MTDIKAVAILCPRCLRLATDRDRTDFGWKMKALEINVYYIRSIYRCYGAPADSIRIEVSDGELKPLVTLHNCGYMTDEYSLEDFLVKVTADGALIPFGEFWCKRAVYGRMPKHIKEVVYDEQGMRRYEIKEVEK